jgi:small GTP-binding protein
MQSLKIVVCGDGAVGKTTFLISFTLACFPTEYIPTVFDNYSTVYEFEGRKISLGLWDTAGQEDFQTIRPLSYKGADVFLMFFSVALPSSAENIKAKWLSEIRQHCPETPVYLIASQTDLRENPKTLETLAARKEKPLSTAQGQQLAKDIKAFGYSELCSKEGNNGYREVFDTVLRYVINDKKQQKVPGKFCWSIHCREKIGGGNKVKCQTCSSALCNDCIEIWEDGFKGCPQCVMYEREKRTTSEAKIPGVKKARIPPEVKLEKMFGEMRLQYEKDVAARNADADKPKDS